MENKISSSSFSPSFLKVYDDMILSKKLSPSEILVFEAIKSFTDKNLTTCISYGKIRQITGLSKTNIISCIKILRKKGVLSVQTRIANDGSYLANRYILHDFDVTWENGNNTNLENLIFNHNNHYYTDINDFNTNKNRHFISVPFDLIKSKLSISAKHIYLFLLKHLNSKTGDCFPSVKRLANESGYCIMTVRKAIKELQDAGLIKKVFRFISGTDAAGRQTSNQYDILKFTGSEKSGEKKVLKKALNKVDDTKALNPEITEEWTLDKITEYYDFELLTKECKDKKSNTDIIPAIKGSIHEVLNTGNDRKIFINGSLISAETVKSIYKDLTWLDLLYVVNNYNHVNHKITNHMAYLKTMLYRAKAQAGADIINQVNVDFPEFT